ncbi:uncharacterized protein ATNIH1004_001700 [Aspergillus tanneri]|uniref:Uncharacterized protein n=1 Tax=Aspergillus tanneri TaxID=1220188 RepID=A0A5M9N0C9_9EURO|nr:uncharacterized protein ATNIH1004_001700 [Aspergillus tanneri]KAA8652795.1 hypothetical protein ATNIH1004_001700 [Aspergillus tanneri]
MFQADVGATLRDQESVKRLSLAFQQFDHLMLEDKRRSFWPRKSVLRFPFARMKSIYQTAVDDYGIALDQIQGNFIKLEKAHRDFGVALRTIDQDILFARSEQEHAPLGSAANPILIDTEYDSPGLCDGNGGDTIPNTPSSTTHVREGAGGLGNQLPTDSGSNIACFYLDRDKPDTDDCVFGEVDWVSSIKDCKEPALVQDEPSPRLKLDLSIVDSSGHRIQNENPGATAFGGDTFLLHDSKDSAVKDQIVNSHLNKSSTHPPAFKKRRITAKVDGAKTSPIPLEIKPLLSSHLQGNQASPDHVTGGLTHPLMSEGCMQSLGISLQQCSQLEFCESALAMDVEVGHLGLRGTNKQRKRRAASMN